ncbi:MAG TPA: glucose-6-phosphate dehydrogenase assembly protein OpcA [Solirubrobacteraceae bacterium]|jgi:glucose-6-phosphate dehydrogenase assembly protein OpcA|nr:glucose-6-phosphate dehydrogenase assembly protein OpcA [Solirubrobacteraceae bacterium]
MAAPCAPPIPDAVWSAEGTTPDAIEAALRELVNKRHAENGGLAPSRALNMVAFVESGYAGEIANRLAGVGRYHASRLVVLSYDPKRLRLDARAVVSTDNEPTAGEIGLMRETVTVEIGARHLDDLVTIVDPLVVTDLATLLWSPHGHPEAVDELLALAQTVLIDSLDEPSWREAVGRACELRSRAYVVDLAWLRSIPWRERVAAAFDSPAMRAELGQIESVSVRYHPDSTVAALLMVGWLGSRLGWEMSRLLAGDGLAGRAVCGEREIAIHLEPAPEQQVRGLESVAIATASGQRIGLRRGDGGLRARRRDADGHEREWTILGASRGESGILGEGIRQSLLRDPTYGPALQGAETMTP